MQIEPMNFELVFSLAGHGAVAKVGGVFRPRGF